MMNLTIKKKYWTLNIIITKPYILAIDIYGIL